MPPRKSDGDDGPSAVGNESILSSAPEKTKEHKDATVIEDLTLPKSIITRLAKGVLPPNTQIQANAILAMSKSATVFINYLASHANENTLSANKKTIAPADVFKALDDIEFPFFKESLEAEFAKFNQIQTEKRTNYRQKSRAKPSDAGNGAPGDDTEMADTTAADTTLGEDETAPRAKKQRVDPEAGAEEDAETEEEQDDHEEDDDEQEEEEEEDGEDDQAGKGASGDETQDALEERPVREEADEALDGDDSD